ncbi:hypothetical protein SNEBB_000466 [Seison nebaliae]|nr:hypothetical protein SNEBB_000466 [Seison nebaliae]
MKRKFSSQPKEPKEPKMKEDNSKNLVKETTREKEVDEESSSKKMEEKKIKKMTIVKYNIVDFICPILDHKVRIGHGITMPCCNDNVCRACLYKYMLVNIEGVSLFEMIPCPCCLGVMDFEVARLLLKKRDMEKLLLKLLKYWQANNKTFHCTNANCSNFIELPETLKDPIYKCTHCGMEGCVVCGVSHNNEITCAEAADKTILATHEYFVRENFDGKIMKCPKCKIYISKLAGCDYIHCRCQTELCYATKGLRRGPDGCHCKSPSRGYQACAPDCKGCH